MNRSWGKVLWYVHKMEENIMIGPFCAKKMDS